MPKKNTTKPKKLRSAPLLQRALTCVQAHWQICILVAIYLVVGTLLAHDWYSYQLNPDAIAYLDVAKKYADGNIVQAINGYWGPLFSWLSVPLVWLDVNYLVGARLLNLGLGAVILCVMYGCLLRARTGKMIALVLSILAAPLLLEWTVVAPITPDILLALLLLLFAVALDVFMRRPTARVAMVVGAIGAAMYATKSIGLPLFVATLGVVAAWQWRFHHLSLRQVSARFAPALAIFAIFAVPYITLISLKYDAPTIGTSGAYNYSVVGPDFAWKHPMTTGIQPPPNDTATSVWEDPSYLAADMPKWNPIGSGERLHYFWSEIIVRNLNSFVVALYSFGPLVAVGLAVMTAGVIGRAHRRQYRLFALLSALQVAAYALLAIEARYLLPVALFGLVSAGLLVAQLQKAKLLSSRQILLLAAAAMLITSYHAGYMAVAGKYTDKSVLVDVQALSNHFDPNSRVVTNNFNYSVFYCYYLQMQCYGTLTLVTDNDDAYYQSLKQQGITHYLVLNEKNREKRLDDFLQRHFELVAERNEHDQVLLYKMR